MSATSVTCTMGQRPDGYENGYCTGFFPSGEEAWVFWKEDAPVVEVQAPVVEPAPINDYW
jgi:hypothetical protein